MVKATRSAEDTAADKRISMRLFALPTAIEKQIDGHLYMGTGVAGERALLAALAAHPASLPRTEQKEVA